MAELGLPLWRGWELWHVMIHGRHSLRELTTTWSIEQVLEAYYYLRMRDLTEPRGGVY